jgi:hypothetical protein
VTVGTMPSTGTSAPPRPGLGVALAFLAAGLALGFIGRATMIARTDLATAWPAAAGSSAD